jgi:uridylate kinase
MINVKTEVLQALESNQVLISLLENESRIYQHTVPEDDATKYPRITFFEMENMDNNFADDTAISSDIYLQIDVWSKGSTTKIAQEVDKTLKQLQFSRTSATDLYENDTAIFHKAMRYRTIKFY